MARRINLLAAFFLTAACSSAKISGGGTGGPDAPLPSDNIPGEDNPQTPDIQPPNPQDDCRSQSRTRFLSAVVPFGVSCVEETQQALCVDGVLGTFSGTYSNPSCQVSPPSNCEGIAHGDTLARIRYDSASVPFGSVCVSEEQLSVCHNGVQSEFSGTFAQTTCVVDVAPPQYEEGYEVLIGYDDDVPLPAGEIGDLIEVKNITMPSVFDYNNDPLPPTLSWECSLDGSFSDECEIPAASVAGNTLRVTARTLGTSVRATLTATDDNNLSSSLSSAPIQISGQGGLFRVGRMDLSWPTAVPAGDKIYFVGEDYLGEHGRNPYVYDIMSGSFTYHRINTLVSNPASYSAHLDGGRILSMYYSLDLSEKLFGYFDLVTKTIDFVPEFGVTSDGASPELSKVPEGYLFHRTPSALGGDVHLFDGTDVSLYYSESPMVSSEYPSWLSALGDKLYVVVRDMGAGNEFRIRQVDRQNPGLASSQLLHEAVQIEPTSTVLAMNVSTSIGDKIYIAGRPASSSDSFSIYSIQVTGDVRKIDLPQDTPYANNLTEMTYSAPYLYVFDSAGGQSVVYMIDTSSDQLSVLTKYDTVADAHVTKLMHANSEGLIVMCEDRTTNSKYIARVGQADGSHVRLHDAVGNISTINYVNPYTKGIEHEGVLYFSASNQSWEGHIYGLRIGDR